MNTATVHQHRPMLPMLSLLAAGCGDHSRRRGDRYGRRRVVHAVTDASGVDSGCRAPPAAASSRADSSSVDDHAGDCLFVVPGVATRC